MKGAVRTASHHVAGVKPAALPGFRGGFGVLEVFAEEAVAWRGTRMAHQKLTGFINAGFRTAIGHDAGLEFVSQAAKTTGAGVAWLAGSDDHGPGARFRHRPGLDQRKAEPRLERIVQRPVDAGAKAETHAVAFVVGAFAHQHRRHHAEIVHDGGAALLDAGPPAFGVEAVERDQAAAGGHHRHGGIGHRVHVEDRKRRQHPLGALIQRDQAADIGVPMAGIEKIFVRQHAALRPAGSA